MLASYQFIATVQHVVSAGIVFELCRVAPGFPVRSPSGQCESVPDSFVPRSRLTDVISVRHPWLLDSGSPCRNDAYVRDSSQMLSLNLLVHRRLHNPSIPAGNNIQLKFNALLGFNALLESMFDQRHFSHGIGDFYHFRRGIAAGHDQMQPGRLFFANKIGNFSA
jgi:hypothetical protein